jgi:hypothetical protein
MNNQKPEEDITPPLKTKAKTKILKWVVLVFLLVVVILFLLVPVYISSEKGRKTILAKINESIEGRLNFSSLSAGWFKGITIAELSFDDRTGRMKVFVKQIKTKPHYASFLIGTPSLGKTVIDTPAVRINLPAKKPVVSVPTAKPSAPTVKKKEPASLPVRQIDLTINNGSVKVTDAESHTAEFSQINSNLNLRPPGQKSSFDVNMVVAEDGKESKVSAQAQIQPQPKTGWSLEGTSGQLSVKADDFDIGSLESLFALAGINIESAGNVSMNITGSIEKGRLETVSGNIVGKNLDITLPQLKGDRFKSAALDVALDVKADEKLFTVDKFNVQADWLKADLAGSVPKTFGSLDDFLAPDSKHQIKGNFECDLASAMSQMPATLGLVKDAKITSGKLTGKIETTTVAEKRKITGYAELASLQGVVKDKAVALAEPVKANLEISSGKEGISYDKVQLFSSFAKIDCSGTEKLLKYESAVDLEKLQNQLGQFFDMGQFAAAGRFNSEGQLDLGEKVLSANGSAGVDDFRLTSAKGLTVTEPKLASSFNIKLDTKKMLLTIDSLLLQASFGNVNVQQSTVSFDKETKEPINLNADASQINLARLQPFACTFGILPQKTQLAGIGNSKLSITSKAGLYRFLTDSTTIENLQIAYPGKQPFEQKKVSIEFDVEADSTGKTINVKRLHLASSDIGINVDKALAATDKDGQTSLQASATVDYDWQALSKMISVYLPSGLNVTGKRKDKLSFSSQYKAGQVDQLLANLNSDAKLGFESAEYMGLNFGPTEVGIKVKSGQATIEPFSTTVNDGQLSFAAELDLRQKPYVLKTPEPIQIAKDIHINDQMGRQLLVYLNPIFKDQANVQGIANLRCKKLVLPLGKDPLLKPDIAGTVSIDKMRLQTTGLLGLIMAEAGTGPDVQAELKPTDFIVQNGIVSYDNMQLVLGQYPIDFAGIIGPQRKLNMTVTTPYIMTADFKLRPVRSGEARPDQRLDLPLTGTIDRPEFNLAKFVEKLLQQQLQQQLGEKLLEQLLKK